MFGDLLKTAHESMCLVSYINKAKKSQVCDFREIVSCNTNLSWTDADNETEWACNNVLTYPKFYATFIYGPMPSEFNFDWSKTYRQNDSIFHPIHYTNVFCALCDPIQNFTTNFISKCNVTGMWTTYNVGDEMKCNFLPEIFYYYPFKNLYCALCNGMQWGRPPEVSPTTNVLPYDRIPGVNWFSITRNLFSISPEEDIHYEYDVHQCRDDQLYDYIAVSSSKFFSV